MKKLISVLLAVVLFIPSAGQSHSAVEVDLFGSEITDEILAKMVADGTIPHDTTHLILALNSISNLTPLAGLTQLHTLELYGNQISDLSPLAGLTGLLNLHLDFNNISDLTPLSELSKLEHLTLNQNNVTDVSPLRWLFNMKVLSLAQNKIKNISPLLELHGLVELHLDFNDIDDIEPLFVGYDNVSINLVSFKGDLQTLTFSGNKISDISPLGKLHHAELIAFRTASNLKTLIALDNGISDILALRNLRELEFVMLCNNEITDIAPLEGLPRLEWLSLYGNKIGDITPLINNKPKMLDWVHLEENPIPFAQIDLLKSALPNAFIFHTAEEPFKLGHVLGGMKITTSDALEILKFIVGLPSRLDTSHGAFSAALIVNADKPCTEDALEILKYIVGLPNKITERSVH